MLTVIDTTEEHLDKVLQRIRFKRLFVLNFWYSENFFKIFRFGKKNFFVFKPELFAHWKSWMISFVIDNLEEMLVCLNCLASTLLSTSFSTSFSPSWKYFLMEYNLTLRKWIVIFEHKLYNWELNCSRITNIYRHADVDGAFDPWSCYGMIMLNST